jgi:hypothetical protein
MDTFEDDHPKNIYVIRRKLAGLQKVPGRSHYEMDIGNFTVVIYTYQILDTPPPEPDSIVMHKEVSVVLNERTKAGITSSVSLRDDTRFKTYEPIQYNVITTPSGSINLSDGQNMPITHLCELIRYLHRLSNLTAFM